MGYINIIATMKWRDPHTKKLKYCSCAKFDENNNTFGKGWSPIYTFMNGKDISSLPTLKN